MKLNQIENAVETLPGIGPATAKLFTKLGIFSVGDLLATYPRSYDDRTKRSPLCNFEFSKVHTICRVTCHDWFGYGSMKTLKIGITDGTANAWLIAFNRPFLQKSLPVNSIISVTGKFEVKYQSLQCSSFDAERIATSGDLNSFKDAPIPNSGLIPVYPLTEGLSQKNFHKAMSQALKQFAKAIDNELPPDVTAENHLLPKSQALIYIHQPESLEQVQAARKTLIFEELYNFEYKLALRSLRHRGSLPALSEGNAEPYFSTPDSDNTGITEKEAFAKMLSPRQKQLLKRLPFELTPDQMQVISDMNADIDRSQVELNNLMNEEIVGDVALAGSGATLANPDATSTGSNATLANPDASLAVTGATLTAQAAASPAPAVASQPFSMQRLLQGDVGSGKTLVAFFICLRVIDYGSQCAILAPTELLAKQHAINAAKLLEPLGVNVAFLTGNVKASGRENLVNALKSGAINIVIGTHALFSTNVTYRKLGLAVIDEQHRFGVAQREAIIAKGRVTFGMKTHTPDVLMMSATPIPQTLALTLFGDLDVSTIHTAPKGRKPVITHLTAMGNERKVYEEVRKELIQGHQAYFVYPRIAETAGDVDPDLIQDEGNSNSDQRKQPDLASQQDNAPGASSLKSAEEMYTFLSQQVYPQHKCALIHSKIEEAEQNQILEDFRLGKIQVLVATTVVEVGVDVANANCIVIEHADRFGLAELHQLRGRVGRSSLQSYCFLVYSSNLTQTGKDRMKAIYETTDGFKIAEEDLKLRGPGEVTGTAQSGYLTLGIADLARDKELLTQARYAAFKHLQQEQQTLSTK